MQVTVQCWNMKAEIASFLFTEFIHMHAEYTSHSLGHLQPKIVSFKKNAHFMFYNVKNMFQKVFA